MTDSRSIRKGLKELLLAINVLRIFSIFGDAAFGAFFGKDVASNRNNIFKVTKRI